MTVKFHELTFEVIIPTIKDALYSVKAPTASALQVNRGGDMMLGLGL